MRGPAGPGRRRVLAHGDPRGGPATGPPIANRKGRTNAGRRDCGTRGSTEGGPNLSSGRTRRDAGCTDGTSNWLTRRSGADRVDHRSRRQAIPLRGSEPRLRALFLRTSRFHHPEWAQLIDLQTVLPVLEAIWKSSDFHCWGAGGDYSLPGARIQKLHADITDMLLDPQGRVNVIRPANAGNRGEFSYGEFYGRLMVRHGLCPAPTAIGIRRPGWRRSRTG